MKPQHIPSTLTVTSPLIHSDENVETMQRFRREPFWLDGEIVDIPVHSGNAFRGMLRRACALRVIEALGVTDRSLPTETFYLLFSGGYLTGGATYWPVEELERIRGLLPHLALLGCSWGSRLIPGVVDVWRGEPACRELADTPMHRDHPAYRDLPAAPSVFELLTELSFTRRDDLAGDRAADEKSPSQMRFTFEALIPGTRLLHGVTLRTTEPLLIGCLADAVETCTSQQSLGGRSAIGHGRFTWTLAAWAAEQAEHVSAYRKHLADHAGEIRDLLGIPEGAVAA